MAKLIKSYLDYSGGLNADVAPDGLADNELKEAANIDLGERGGFSSRLGTSPVKVTGTCPDQTGMTNVKVKLDSTASAVDDRYNGFIIVVAGQTRTISDYDGTTKEATVSVAWTTQPVVSNTYEIIRKYTGVVEEIIPWERKDGTTTLLAIIGTSLYLIDYADGKETLIIALSSKDIGYFIFQDHFYFTGKEGGVDKYWVYGGTYQVETTTVVGAITTAGNATVIVTADGMTGSPKTISVAVALSDTSMQVATKIRTALNADSAVTSLFIVGGTDSDVSLTALSYAVNDATLNISINNGTCAGLTADTTSSDTTDGIPMLAEVTPNEGAGNDLAPIKRCRKFIWHPKSLRIFAAGDPTDMTALYYSESSDPTYFKVISKLYPSTADGPINSLSLFGTAMVAIYFNGGWAWKGVDPSSDATWERMAITQGVTAGRTTILTPNTLSFIGMGGLYALSPSALDYNVVMVTGNEIIRSLSNNKVNKLIKAITHRDTMFSMYDQYNNRYMLTYGDDATDSRNNKMLILQWELGSFVIYDGLAVNNMCQLNDGTILASSGNYLLKMDSGENDWDIVNDCYKAIHWKVETKGFSLGVPFHLKKISSVLFAASQSVDISNADVKILCDYQNVDIDDISVDVNNISMDDSFVWGDIWGVLKWGWIDLITKEIKVSMRGNRISVIFERESLDESATIYGIAFIYKRKKPKGVLVDYEV